jgi:TRAP-type transport system small permease protein
VSTAEITVERASRWYGLFIQALMFCACVGLGSMALIICADVFVRNLGLSTLDFSNEVSEDILYLATLLASPWILRLGQHVRVDIVLRVLPVRLGRLLEWAGDWAGLVCCLCFVWYGAQAAIISAQSGALSIKTLVMPDWWIVAPLPVTFALLAIEFLFRMHRLSVSRHGIRDDAVSAG